MLNATHIHLIFNEMKLLQVKYENETKRIVKTNSRICSCSVDCHVPLAVLVFIP